MGRKKQREERLCVLYKKTTTSGGVGNFRKERTSTHPPPNYQDLDFTIESSHDFP